MVTNLDYVKQADSGKYIGIPYTTLDCQALMEQVLKDLGIKYNWRGSNHMWREALYEKHKITDWNEVPKGAWIFDVRNDGGEKKHDYKDNEGNACHVGIYLGDGRIIHSTTGGVQYDTISNPRWTHYGLCRFLTYVKDDPDTKPNLIDLLSALKDTTLKELFEAVRKLGW